MSGSIHAQCSNNDSMQNATNDRCKIFRSRLNVSHTKKIMTDFRFQFFQVVLDCGGKRSSTPLSPALKLFSTREPSVRPKALSPLRSASALQDPPNPSITLANIECWMLSIFSIPLPIIPLPFPPSEKARG